MTVFIVDLNWYKKKINLKYTLFIQGKLNKFKTIIYSYKSKSNEKTYQIDKIHDVIMNMRKQIVKDKK
jgi:hypothetical protein